MPDIPVYPGAQHVERKIVNNTTDVLGVAVTELSFVTSDKPEDVLRFYSDELYKNGWRWDVFCDAYKNDTYERDYLANVHAYVSADGVTRASVDLSQASAYCP